MDSLGELVKAWRLGSGLSQKELASKVGGTVKYQNIQQLESGEAKLPRYIAALAVAMRTTVEELTALRMPPLLGDPVYLPGNHDRAEAEFAEAVPEATVAAALRFLAETISEKDEATREAAAAAIAAVIKRPDRVEQFTRALEALLENTPEKPPAPKGETIASTRRKPPRKRTGTAG